MSTNFVENSNYTAKEVYLPDPCSPSGYNFPLFGVSFVLPSHVDESSSLLPSYVVPPLAQKHSSNIKTKVLSTFKKFNLKKTSSLLKSITKSRLEQIHTKAGTVTKKSPKGISAKLSEPYNKNLTLYFNLSIKPKLPQYLTPLYFI